MGTNGISPGKRRFSVGTRTGDMASNFTFDKFRFETESGRLWSERDGAAAHTESSRRTQGAINARRPPVPKEDLFTFVWDGVSVGDDALTSCVQELRKALADDAKKPRFIETRHRRGYQFVAQLTEAHR